MINQFSKWHLTWQCYRRIVSSINHSFLEYVSISKLETFFPKVSFHCPASNPSACFSTERGPPGSWQLAGIIPNSGSRLDLDPARISFGEMVRYGSSRVCLIFLYFGTRWHQKPKLASLRCYFCVVLSYSGTFQYIHIIILVLRMNIRTHSRIILQVTLGNWEAEYHIFGPYLQRFDHHSHFQFPYPLSPLRWISPMPPGRHPDALPIAWFSLHALGHRKQAKIARSSWILFQYHFTSIHINFI